MKAKALNAPVLTGAIVDRSAAGQAAPAVRVEGSRTVHLAGTSVDRYDEELPAPACRTGIAGWDPRRLRVSLAPVTCRRCLGLVQRRQMPVPVHDTLF
ncbi:hypothetical protein [Nonomuraea ceibae]|uniref:hypothetical protein n=1 Tax=Nonomuraea ceibae TaxID=1935170 RepID=UPI001C5FDF6C|nr:hypothetical protein [Nonomuraea ceibae]